MLYTMVNALINRLVKNPVVASIIMSFIGIFLDKGSAMVQPALNLIMEAAGFPLTNTDRFQYVLTGMQERFPDVGENILKQIIETSIGFWKAQNK